MDLNDPASGQVLLIVLVVLGYALSITLTNRTVKRVAFIAGSASLFFALIQASGHDGLIPILYRWIRGEEGWFPSVILDNNRLFSAYLAAVGDLALLFGLIAGIFAALGLLGNKLLQQIARLAVVALLAAFVGSLATVRLLSAGFGGYGTHDVFFGKPSADDIVDGDSLKLGGAELRLAGIDAPEYRDAKHEDWNKENQPCLMNGKYQPCGQDAREALSRLAKGKRVVCTRIAHEFFDRYGRPVVRCIVHVPDEADIELSERMAADGAAAIAEDMRKLDQDYALRLHSEISTAQSTKKGLWAGCMIKPALWRDEADIREAFKHGKWDDNNVVDPKSCTR